MKEEVQIDVQDIDHLGIIAGIILRSQAYKSCLNKKWRNSIKVNTLGFGRPNLIHRAQNPRPFTKGELVNLSLW
ncbi:hypothetical protein F7734_13720 [Scytonema sp. UIC 10036]|uniref:hypothetical protein n=1 Tax=Scytonema sp. UIC 10036 TaxID=2304196 RepID=UPI0012DAAE09|nr:hypothetical protein [Scytonema sp. UIC 10036]MUG93430.1 hypothetical protein [Scytonema sp. UIC 10036]